MQPYPTQPPAAGYYRSQTAAVQGAPQPAHPQQQLQYVEGAAPPVQYVQPTVVQAGSVTPSPVVHVITQPPSPPVVYQNYRARQSVVLGGIQVFVGLASIVLNIVGVALQIEFFNRLGSYSSNSYYYRLTNITFYTGYGFWCSVFYILAGSFAIMAGKRKTKCPVIANLVLSVIAAVFVWNHIGFAIASVSIDATTPRGFYMDSYNYSSSREWVAFSEADWSLIQGSLAMGIILLILGLLEFVAAIWSSTLGCRATCCRSSPRTQYVASTQQVMYINSGGQPVPQAGYVTAYPGQPMAAGGVAPTITPPYSHQATAPPENEYAELELHDETPQLFDNSLYNT